MFFWSNVFADWVLQLTLIIIISLYTYIYIWNEYRNYSEQLHYNHTKLLQAQPSPKDQREGATNTCQKPKKNVMHAWVFFQKCVLYARRNTKNVKNNIKPVTYSYTGIIHIWIPLSISSRRLANRDIWISY